ncbi:hypothetical protein VIGAN_01121400, partial [Vigna angularis var. angularis]
MAKKTLIMIHDHKQKCSVVDEMTEAKIPVPTKVAMAVKLPEKRRYPAMDGRWAYYKVQRGWLCFKTEIAQCWKTEYSSRRVAKESF